MTKLLFKSILVVALAVGTVAIASAQTSVTGAIGGVFPPDTAFNGVPISGLESGFGVEVGSSTAGHVLVTLLGVAVGETQQRIVVDGVANAGQRTAPNAAVVSGTASVDMGDGTLPVTGVPFTITVVTDANDQGTLGLVIGETTLPNAVVNAGSQTVK